MDDTKFDDNLFEILKECKVIPKFLDAIFGFLRRRSDFYVECTEDNSPVGLPPGWAENLVRNAFFKWKPQQNLEEIPEPIVETEVITTEQRNPTPQQQQPKPNKTFTNSESYNGATHETYSWSQNISDIDIIVKLPEKTNTKDVSVAIHPNRLTVALKSGETVLDGELCNKCRNTEAIWSLDGHKLQIHLDKASEIWWDCLLKGEPRLDLSKIDCSRPYEDLSQEAQAKIEELTWNEERKRLGLPTSQELEMQEKLRRAWHAEGSPFKGPFDPNAVVFD